MGVWLDAFDLGREAFGHPRPVVDFAFGIGECDICMRIDDARHAEVLPNALTALLILRLHLGSYFGAVLFCRAVFIVPNFSSLVGFCRLVFPSIKANVDHRSGWLARNLRAHVCCSSRRQLAVHDHASDSDSLLTSGLSDGVKPRTKEQLSKHLFDAFLGYARSIVLHNELDDVFLGVNFLNDNPDGRKNTRFFTSIKGVVDSFFHGCDEGPSEGIESEKVFVFLEKLRNCDLFLIRCEFLCDTSHEANPPPRSSFVRMTKGQ